MVTAPFIISFIHLDQVLCGVILLCRAARRRPVAGAGAAQILTALGAGLVLYLFVQSAVERRFVWALFLPFEAGSYLPGRYTALLLCMLLCCAAAFTRRGRALLDRLCTRRDYVRQTYLIPSEPGTTERVRLRGCGAGAEYTHTVKRRLTERKLGVWRERAAVPAVRDHADGHGEDSFIEKY